MCVPAETSLAFTEFERHRHRVYHWAYRVLGDHHDALDVAQDVFLRWRESTDGAIENPAAWLRRVTINRAVDRLRERRRSGMLPSNDVASRGASFARTVDEDESNRRIAFALARLTDTQRRVLTAKVFGELTFAEIARELDIAVPTAKTHYLRALRSLRDRLAIAHDPGGRAS